MTKSSLERFKERVKAQQQIRDAYYGVTDNLYALMGIADTLEDPALRAMCQQFDKELTEHLNSEYSNWD